MPPKERREYKQSEQKEKLKAVVRFSYLN